MTVVMIREQTDEMGIFGVPALVMQLPDDLRDDFCYWQLLKCVQLQPRQIPLGPIRDVEYQYITKPEDADAISLRHPCADCVQGIENARVYIAENPDMVLCVAQCVVDYLKDPRDPRTHFSPEGRLA